MEVVKCENENYNSDNHDVDIILGNKVFKAHSEVLSENSDYFKTRLSSSNKDVHARPVTFEFADAQPTPAAMETVLNFLYDGKITLASSSVREILETARLLNLRHPSFESTMIGYLDLENWYTFLEASRAFEFEAMLEDIRQFASDHFYLVSSTTEYNHLEDSEKADITSKIMTKGKYMHSTVSAVLLHRTEDGEWDSGNVVCCYNEKAKDWLFLGKGFHSDSERFNSDPIFYGASTHKHIMCYSESSQNGSVTVKSFNTKTNSLKTYVSSTEEILQGYGITSTDGSKFYQIASRITKGKLPIILVYGDASNTSPLHSQIITVTFSKESLVFGEARDNIKNNVVDACSFNESLYLLVQQEIIKKGMNRSVFQGILVEISISSIRSEDADIGVKIDREIIISSSMSMKPMLRILCNDDLNVLVVAEDEATLSKYRDEK
ncbi:uncharacterized protein [Ptychodera flava]|uniref:uncharacterized protein n=1 Tax=Ptychodera flava TaxID=63121 RepID=UPI00396A2DCA